jgi:hypothetical protein
MHNYVLNPPITRNQRRLHFMTNAVTVKNSRRWIYLDVKFDEQSHAALSHQTFLDSLYSRLRSGGAYRITKLRCDCPFGRVVSRGL